MYRLQLVAHLTAADRESGSPLFLGPGVYTALPLGSTSSHALYIQGHTILDGDVRQTLFQLKKKKSEAFNILLHTLSHPLRLQSTLLH